MAQSAEWIRRRHRRVLRGLRVVFFVQIIFSVGLPLALDIINQQTSHPLTWMSGAVVGLLLFPQARRWLRWMYLPGLLIIDAVHITALLWATPLDSLARGSLWALGYIPVLIAAGRWWSYGGGTITLALVLVADAAVLFGRLPWDEALPVFVFQMVTASLGTWAAALTESRTRRDLLQREAHQLSVQRLQRAQTTIEHLAVELHSIGHQIHLLDSVIDHDSVATKYHLKHTEQQLYQTITTLQRALRTFGPSPLLERTLPEAIAQQLKTIAAIHAIQPVFRCDGHLPPLSPLIADFLLQAAQELLHNVAHHAQASSVEVDLHGDLHAQVVTLQITDNGSGMQTPLDQLNATSSLTRLHDQTHQFGGTFSLSHAAGTQVTLELPTHVTLYQAVA